MTQPVRDLGWLLLGVTAGLWISAVASPLPFPTIDPMSADVVPLARAAVFILLIGSVRAFEQPYSRLDSR